ncbi:2687_t:CDS:2, partial [Diversispora eburnea]
NNNKVREVFDIQIPEFSLEVIITGSSKITAQNIADLFAIAIKTLVYNEIKTLLPDITDVNLRQKTFRAKKIYILLKGIGVEKVQTITCSASAISSLTDNQIQDIINCFPKKSISVDDSSVKYQEKIGVTNCNAHVTEQSNLNNSETVVNKEAKKILLETEVSITTTPSIKSYHASNSEDIVNENNEFSETVTVIDSFSDSNLESSNEGEGDDEDEFLDKIRSRFCKRYKKKTGLDPWIKSETSQIEKTDNYLSQDCVIKISKFPEEKSIIHDAVHKRFPFLSYTNSNAWYRDVFKYTDPEAKCPICKEVHTRLGIWGDWSCLGKNDHYFLNCPFRIDQKKVIIAVQSLPETQGGIPNKTHLYQPEVGLCQYAIEHKMDPEKFSVITEAEKKRWTMGCFRGDLERDIRCYREGIKRNEDTRKYHKFLTDRDRLVSEELLHCGILKSGLCTAWLDDLMEEWEKIHTQFTQIFNQTKPEDSTEVNVKA